MTTTQRYEVCQIRRLGQVVGWSGVKVWFVAEKVTPDGNEVIGQSKVYQPESSFFGGTDYRKKADAEAELHQALLAQLLADGWEPTGTDDEGKIMALRKPLASAAQDKDTEPSGLLKKLASLRDAGILSQQEYDEKKAEILRRL